ncbi:MAG: hypothetical protein AMXMBFR12_09690 [Candidatus Babeliales bacterium]
MSKIIDYPSIIKNYFLKVDLLYNNHFYLEKIKLLDALRKKT